MTTYNEVLEDGTEVPAGEEKAKKEADEGVVEKVVAAVKKTATKKKTAS